MNRRPFIVVFTLFVGTLYLMAKPGIPLQFKLECSQRENLGEITRYTVDLTITPLAESDRLSLDVKVPEGYRLLNGFKYWEGKVSARSSFTEKLVIEGPTQSPQDVEILGVLHMGKAISSKTLKLRLGPEGEMTQEVYPQITLERDKATDGEGRRIRRE